jgi:aminopeptidase
MHDSRYDKLASLLVSHSTRLKKGEKVLIDAFEIPDEMTVALIRAAREAGSSSKSQTRCNWRR